MVFLLASFFRLVFQTALATAIAARAWSYRPARLFGLVGACFMLLGITSHARETLLDAQTAYGILSLSALSLGGLNVALLLLFSALFMPQWWDGPRPAIRWIALPNILVSLLLLIDLLTPLNLIVGQAIFRETTYTLARLAPGGTVVLSLFGLSWMIHLAILVVAFREFPRLRPMIGIISISLVLSMLIGLLNSQGSRTERYVGLVQTLPILVALAYAVIRGKAFEAKRVALDLALEAMSEAVAVIDPKGEVIYTNPQAKRLGLVTGGQFAQALISQGAGSQELLRLLDAGSQTNLEERRLVMAFGVPTRLMEVSLTPVVDAEQRIQGALFLGRDVTEIERRTTLLEVERSRLAATVSQLQAEQSHRSELAATLQALSFPLIPLLDGVLVMPVIGAFDEQRTLEFSTVLLQGIQRERARLVLIDVTGMTLLDSAGAHGLIQAVAAAALLGARCVLVGVRPELAQSLVGLNSPLGEIRTAATLQQALQPLGFTGQGSGIRGQGSGLFK